MWTGRTWIVALALCSVVSLPVLAARTTDVPVSTIVSDYAADIAPALQIQSDQLGTYTNSKALVSVIQGSSGDWTLSTGSSNRTVYLDFSQPVAGSGPGGGNPVGLPSGLYSVHLISKCHLYGNSMFTLAPGATMNCPFHVGSITYNGGTYGIEMDPYTAANGPFPETGYADVSCIVPSSGSGPCSQWKITPHDGYLAPDGTFQYRTVGKLLEYTTKRGKTVVTDLGDFYFSFQILVLNP
jgi:hypothetical protein